MKKVLFTTTALIASAGIASAEVKLSGYAEMGIAGGDVETQFHHDIDVKFSLSGATDNGLTFGATIDLDEITGGTSPRGNKSSVFISGGFGTLTMGDTDGAFDKVMQEVFAGTAIADDHSSHTGANGNGGLDGGYDGQILRYDYSFGDFAIAASLELDDTGAGDPIYGLGVKYSADMGGVALGFGLGYQSADGGAAEIWGLSVSADMGNGFDAVINYSDFDGVGTHSAIGLHYNSGPLLVGVNYGSFDADGGGSADGFGLVVNYDLGGGATAMLGYGSGDFLSGNSNGDDTFSLGLGLSF